MKTEYLDSELDSKREHRTKDERFAAIASFTLLLSFTCLYTIYYPFNWNKSIDFVRSLFM